MVIVPQDGQLTVRIAPAPLNDRYWRVYGASLTPQNASQVLNAADQGYLWGLADLLDECRERDGHLHSVLAKREMQVAGAEWEVRPPKNSGALGEQIAQYCTDRLLEIEAQNDLGRSFPEALADLQGAHFHGRAVLEVIWGNQGRWWFPKTLEFIHPRRLAYVSDWRLHLWDASGTSTAMLEPSPVNDGPFGKFPGLPLDAFPAGKFVIHRARVRGTYPTREGLGRTVLWYAMFKRFAIRDWVAFAEWAGRGLRVGKYSTGQGGTPRTSKEDVEALKAALNTISSAISTVVPDTTELQIQGAPANNNVHSELSLLCNTEMSKAVLGETLTTEVGQTGGNRALGEVHNEVRLAHARADGHTLGSTLRRDLLRPMVAWSFGPTAPVPEIVFAVDPIEDLDALARRIKLMLDARVPISPSWICATLNMQAPQPGEALLAPAPVSPAVANDPDSVADSATRPASTPAESDSPSSEE